MKKLSLLLLTIVLLCACTPRKEKTMHQLENLVAEAQSHSKDYTADDWAQFITEYHTIDSLLLLDEFT